MEGQTHFSTMWTGTRLRSSLEQLPGVSGNAQTFFTMLWKILCENDHTSNDPSLLGNRALVCLLCCVQSNCVQEVSLWNVVMNKFQENGGNLSWSEEKAGNRLLCLTTERVAYCYLRLWVKIIIALEKFPATTIPSTLLRFFSESVFP